VLPKPKITVEPLIVNRVYVLGHKYVLGTSLAELILNLA